MSIKYIESEGIFSFSSIALGTTMVSLPIISVSTVDSSMEGEEQEQREMRLIATFIAIQKNVDAKLLLVPLFEAFHSP